jgi:sugar transferase (PEP-CTERM system associated)
MLEHLLLMASVYMASILAWGVPHDVHRALILRLPDAVAFATVIIFMMFALGLYNKDEIRDLGTVLTRLIFSFFFGFIALAMIFYVYPGLVIGRTELLIAVALAAPGILLFRSMFLRFANVEAVKRRVLVLGVGAKAARIEKLERNSTNRSFSCIGFVPLSDRDLQIDDSHDIWGNLRLSELAKEREVEEIVVAIDERRGGMPVDALLDCKLAGIAVSDYATFWERETGKVDLDALHPSWLIFSDGFVGGMLQATTKRGFDVATSLTLFLFGLPLMLLTAIAVRLESPGPVFYRQERVGLNGHPFMLMKFRSMRTDAEKDGVPRWADVNDSRITRVGAFIRKSRIDEIPQILNVLKGQMSFIGPRPERPFFVSQLGEIIPYYFERHRVKPGISGWAQLNYPYGASNEDAKEKFQYDLYYIKNYSLFLDFIVLVQTARVVLWPSGVR